MLTRDFDYELPDDAVAQRPLPRGESRLLVLDASGDGAKENGNASAGMRHWAN